MEPDGASLLVFAPLIHCGAKLAEDIPMSEDLTASRFQALIGSRFIVTPPAGEPFPVELLEVTLLEAHDGPRPQPFSAVFVDPRKSIVWQQQIFHVEQETLGTFDLFLVPIGPCPQGLRYEAVFN